LTNYSRFKTREVYIGDIPLGAAHPIRIQSMTTPDTMDTLATVKQTIRLVEAGCDYVRITTPSLKEAQNLEEIKKELKKRGCNVPLIADIHYTPNAAELVAKIVEKVRVNPGNYADKKKFEIKEYTEATYKAELDRIRRKFTPLVKVCKEYGTALRIGTNHGSLSDRIMSRYGDTPLGMVESALEFVRICEDLKYYDIVLSMKASNPQVMVQAYRLLVNKMMKEGMNYPIHLGVTEAGDGEDGRIKSALGIGALLEDGIGDTVRVSLTEEPEEEVPVAIDLVDRYKNRGNHQHFEEPTATHFNPYEYTKRVSDDLLIIGNNNVPRVFIDLSKRDISRPEQLKAIGYDYSVELDKWTMGEMAADFIHLGKQDLTFNIPGTLRKIFDADYWINTTEKATTYPLFSADEYVKASTRSPYLNFIAIDSKKITQSFLDNIKQDKTVVLVLTTKNRHAMAEQRQVFMELDAQGMTIPVIIKRVYNKMDADKAILYASTDIGTLFIDGWGDGIWLDIEETSMEFINKTSFGILQAARMRISKTEYISCPSCGRTLFDLQETTAMIRSRTAHLKGVKIGIMGCIVNGPGEMADADYGYVGSGPGKITLYKGKEVVKRNVDTALAVDELIALIKKDDKWTEVQS